MPDPKADDPQHPGNRPWFSTEDHPIQSFLWSDYTPVPGTDYTYTIAPMYGEPGALEPRGKLVLEVHTGNELAQGMLRAYSNHVSAAQQLRGVIELDQTPWPNTTPSSTSTAAISRTTWALGRDVYADGVGVGVPRRAPNPVGGQQNSALEDEVAGMGGAGEPVQQRFESVPDQVLLRRCARPGLRRCGTGDGLDPAEHRVAGTHPSISNACRTGDRARGSRDAMSISRAGLPRRSHSRSASRASSYPTSLRSRYASAIDRSGE